MSRSYRKTKIFGNAGGSEKADKKEWHSVARTNERIVLEKLKKNEIDEDEVLFDKESETIDTWGMQKDGRHYWKNATDADMRK